MIYVCMNTYISTYSAITNALQKQQRTDIICPRVMSTNHHCLHRAPCNILTLIAEWRRSTQSKISLNMTIPNDGPTRQQANDQTLFFQSPRLFPFLVLCRRYHFLSPTTLNQLHFLFHCPPPTRLAFSTFSRLVSLPSHAYNSKIVVIAHFVRMKSRDKRLVMLLLPLTTTRLR